MKKMILICLVLAAYTSCTAMSEYDREQEESRKEQRAGQLEGVKLPPETVLDCYNILGADSFVTGRIVMENSRPVLDGGCLLSYQTDKNMVSCKYEFAGADPVPRFFVTVVMIISSDKKIYAVCNKINTSTYFDDPLETNYFIYKSKKFEKIEYKSLPADVKEKADKISWPPANVNWHRQFSKDRPFRC